MSDLLFGDVSGLSRMPVTLPAGGMPLVVAIHGGSYTSRYFDVPGYSLLDRAAANGIPAVAIDRPMYGRTAALANDDATLRAQANYLRGVLPTVWEKFGAGCAGIVLVGHSIGAAITALTAGDPDDLPLLGVALSGVGLRTPPKYRGIWSGLPDLRQVEMPVEVKDQVMFGPPGSFDAAAMPRDSHLADSLAPKAELIEIVSAWEDGLVDVLGRIAVPVHYRQAEFDQLWIVDEHEVAGFGRALARSARVDAAMMPGTGHCIDFHHAGPALQLQQLGFAMQCAAEMRRKTEA